MKKTFWDFCAPIYDFFESINGDTYRKMVKTVADLTPAGSTVLEAACGTAEIGIAVSKKAKSVVCIDISEDMLKIAGRKIRKQRINNITLSKRSIYETKEPDGAFDTVIAAQVLHLLDDPQKAADELYRITEKRLILPLALTKNLTDKSKFLITLYKIVGFSPKLEFDYEDYKNFIVSLGFEKVKFIKIDGAFSISIAVIDK
ncbi:MAG: class I SAM-dependent methyltransferase [Ruminococcus sp.]|jgi:ubiquinone/menaquinone biosynthesis C-methylase UbiE|nr:class I SAM-dependent methyltransferase [Ruminococcus sp.]